MMPGELREPRKEFDSTMLATYALCPRKYDFRINKGLVGKRPPVAADFGKAIHMALDEWFAGKGIDVALNTFRNNFTESEDDSKRTYLMGEWIIANYAEKYVDQPWKVLASEQEFTLPLPNGKFYMGRIDKIIEWVKTVWVVDHKAQPLASNVLTPKGWKLMGDLRVGDSIIGSSGKPSKVIGIYPQGALDCYEVSFMDGAKVLCSDNHLWRVTDMNSGRELVLTLKEIKRRMGTSYGKQGRTYRFKVPIMKPAECEYVPEFYISPYLLGVILGDGCITGRTVDISIGDADAEEVLRNLRKELPKGMGIKRNSSKNFNYGIRSSQKGCNKLIRELEKLGLMGLQSNKKFVPNTYKLCSIKQRLELLQGLLDTDGCIYKGHIIFDSTSRKLAEDVVDLVRSLGGIARIRARSYTNKPAYRVAIRFNLETTPFRLQRKANKIVPNKRPLCRYIKNIKKVAPRNMQCIRIDSTDSLYVTDDYILTHNTTSSLGPQFTKMAMPNGQFTGYVWAARKLGFNAIGIIVDAMLVAGGLLIPSRRANLTPLLRYDSYRSDEQIEEWRDTVIEISNSIEMAEKGACWPPSGMFSGACTYYGECPYRKLCSEDKGLRERLIASEYQVDFWDPRGEEKEMKE